jgi:hypothetical protein
MANHPNRPKKNWFRLEECDEAILRALFDMYGAGRVMAVLSRFQSTRDREGLFGQSDEWHRDRAERVLRDSRAAVKRMTDEALADFLGPAGEQPAEE